MPYINRQGKLFRHLDRIEDLKKGKTSPPINVEIDLSNRCNLGCYFCHFAYTHVRGPLKGKQEKPLCSIPGGDIMNYELANNIIDQLEEFGVRSLTFTGGGEPTLHPDFDEIISRIKIDVGLYTNGTTIDKNRALLLKNQCIWVYVSLDAADEEEYKKEKSSSQFKDALQGIDNLVEAKGNATIGIGFIVNSHNWLNVEKYIDLGEMLGVDYIQFRPAILYDIRAPYIKVENTSWMNYAIQHLDKIKEERRVIVDIDRFREYRDWQNHSYLLCYWSALQTIITPNGKVWTCVDKREFPDAELGDLNIETFRDIWKKRNIALVNDACRIMCCGHPANLVLNELFSQNSHSNFV